MLKTHPAEASRRTITGRLLIAGTLALAMLATTGCARIRGHQGFIMDKTLTDAVQPGIDNRESVERTLGRPTFTGQFGSGDNEWYYLSRETRQLAFADPRAIDQSVLRVTFDPAGRVAAVNRTGIETVAHLSPVGDKTPTLGRHRTLLEDIFGNIGAVNGATAPGANN